MTARSLLLRRRLRVPGAVMYVLLAPERDSDLAHRVLIEVVRDDHLATLRGQRAEESLVDVAGTNTELDQDSSDEHRVARYDIW